MTKGRWMSPLQCLPTHSILVPGQPGVPPNRSLSPATRNMSPSVTTSVEWPVSIVDGAIALSVSFIGYESSPTD